MTTYDRVKGVLVRSLGYGPDEVKAEYSLWGDLAFDSLKMVEFAMALEDEFEIAVDDTRDYEKMTVQDIVEIVDAQLATARPALALR